YFQKRYEDALEAFDAPLTVRPDFPHAHRLRGVVFQARGNMKEAVRAYDDYFKQRGKPLPEVYEARALAWLVLKDYPRALADFSQALDLQPKNAAQLRTHRGWTYIVLNHPKLAWADFDKAVKGDPKNADAYAGRGYARVRLVPPNSKEVKEVEEAVADADRARFKGHKTASLLWKAARIYAQAAARTQTGLVRENYTKKAVKSLQAALDCVKPESRGQFWSDTVKDDPDLAVL